MERVQVPSKHTLGVAMVRRSVWALAIGGGLFGATFVEALFAPFSPYRLARVSAPAPLLALVAVCTTVLLARALSVGLSHRRGVGPRTFWSCALHGWLNCPVTVGSLGLAILLVHGGSIGAVHIARSLFVLLSTAAVLGFFVALPLGMLFGASSLFAVRRLRRLIDNPSHDAWARAAWAVGVTLLFAGAACTVVVLMTQRHHSVTIPAWAPLSLAWVGAGLALHAHLVQQRIDHVLDAARAGTLSGFARVPRAQIGDEAGDLLPLTQDVSPRAGFVLVRTRRGWTGGAYRAAATREPWALID